MIPPLTADRIADYLRAIGAPPEAATWPDDGFYPALVQRRYRRPHPVDEAVVYVRRLVSWSGQFGRGRNAER